MKLAWVSNHLPDSLRDPTCSSDSLKRDLESFSFLSLLQSTSRRDLRLCAIKFTTDVTLILRTFVDELFTATVCQQHNVSARITRNSTMIGSIGEIHSFPLFIYLFIYNEHCTIVQ